MPVYSLHFWVVFFFNLWNGQLILFSPTHPPHKVSINRKGEKGTQTGKSPEKTGTLAEKPQSLVEDRKPALNRNHACKKITWINERSHYTQLFDNMSS